MSQPLERAKDLEEPSKEEQLCSTPRLSEHSHVGSGLVRLVLIRERVPFSAKDA